MVTQVRINMIETGGFATAADVDALRTLFVGAISVFPYLPDAPWIACYGQTLNVSDYPLLAAKLGTTYGGNGTTTFALPDYRGRVPAGLDSMGGASANRLTEKPGGVNGDILGAVGGHETHVLTEAQLATHDHAITGSTGAAGSHTHDVTVQAADGSGGLIADSSGGSQAFTATGSVSTAPAHTHTLTGTAADAGSNAPHNNVQPTIIQYYCILSA